MSSRRLADGLEHRLKRAGPRLGSLSPDPDVGLDEASIAVLRAWADGAPLGGCGLTVPPPDEPAWHRR